MELQQIPLPFMVVESQYLHFFFFFGSEYKLFFFFFWWEKWKLLWLALPRSRADWKCQGINTCHLHLPAPDAGFSRIGN